MSQHTNQQFDSAIKICRDLFEKKLLDYGASWRMLRASSLTDQILIKAMRIRSLELNGGHSMVGEGILPEFIGIVNYGIIGMIQLKLGHADKPDMATERALELYDKYMGDTRSLMIAKNHDYDEAWRAMRVSTYTDFILTKVQRTKSIEDNAGATLVSEGIDANYQDMINYAIFAIIKLAIEGREE